MPTANNKGVRLHWDEQGQGTPVLLVMGHRYSSAMWYPVIPALAKEHRVIWFDNRGSGQSDTPTNFGVQDLAADAFAVMDAAGVDRAHLFGVSMGGGIVLEMAMERPGRVISLIPGCTCLLTAEKPRMPAFMRALYYLPPWMLKMLMPNRRGNSGYGANASPEAIAKDMAVLAKEPRNVKGGVAQATAIASYCATREAAQALTMPALVIHGDEDAAVPFAWGEELSQILPNSRFLPITGAGHNFFVAGGEPVNTAVADFLREVDRGE